MFVMFQNLSLKINGQSLIYKNKNCFYPNLKKNMCGILVCKNCPLAQCISVTSSVGKHYGNKFVAASGASLQKQKRMIC